jgi:hypothetical protein
MVLPASLIEWRAQGVLPTIDASKQVAFRRVVEAIFPPVFRI